jgi:hypothetical protein
VDSLRLKVKPTHLETGFCLPLQVKPTHSESGFCLRLKVKPTHSETRFCLRLQVKRTHSESGFCLRLQVKFTHSESGFSLYLQVKPTQFGPIDRDNPYLRTFSQTHTICTNVPSSQTFRSYLFYVLHVTRVQYTVRTVWINVKEDLHNICNIIWKTTEAYSTKGKNLKKIRTFWRILSSEMIWRVSQ